MSETTNTPNGIYLIKGKLYGNIISCIKGSYYGNPILKITFSNSKTAFNYNPEDVTFYPYKRTVEGDFRVKDHDGHYYISNKIHLYGNNQAYGIESRKRYISYILAKNAEIESSILTNGRPQVIDYLSSLSDISTIGAEDGNITSLRQKYDNLKYLFKGSLLASYCNPESYKSERKSCPLLIFPFGCNKSQYEAVRNALENRLSVVQGPPGTGKTQTILNIVSNLLIYDKNCLIVSNNNSAVSNVIEKLSQPKYGFDFLVAALGNVENKENFINSQKGEWPDLSSWKISQHRNRELRLEIKSIEGGLKEYFDSQEKLAELRELEAEQRFQMELSESLGMTYKSRLLKFEIVSLSSLYKLLLRYDSDIQKYGKLRLTTKFRAMLLGVDSTNRENLEKAIHTKEYLQTVSLISELKKSIAKYETSYKKYQEISLEFLKSILAKRYGKYPLRRTFTRREIELTDAQSFLNDYPIVTSTTFSATTNIDQLVPFDYLIMDEASQVDITAGALSLNCVKSAVIVGDPKQLPNVVVDKDAEFAEKIFRESNLSYAYRYVNNSFLDSILKLFPDSPVTLLKEHYRCHPLIIGYCNKQFYNNQLVIMTKQDTEDKPLSIIRSVRGNHARGTQNRRQAEDIVEVVKELIKEYDDIGIIAPYRAQTDLIKTLLQENNLPEIPVSTVHKFQGRENDVIILSTVDNKIQEFVDDPHLLNVAVSRAKKMFVLAITGNEIVDSNISNLVDYITYYNGEVIQSQVSSVFDILYQQYAEERKKFVKERLAISQYESENIMYALLDQITASEEWNHLGVIPQYPLGRLIKSDVMLTESERRYARNSWTLVDFILYHKTTKYPVLAIEVDGMAFHKKGSEQSQRDALKNSVLEKAQIPLIRLSTDGSNEKSRIIKALMQTKVLL